MPFRARTSLPSTETTKFPFPGLTGLMFTSTAGLSFAISSTSFFEDLPNRPQDLHASITTAPLDRGAESVEDISVRLRLGGMGKH